MKNFNFFLFVQCAVSAILLSSCGDDDAPVPVVEEPEYVVFDNNASASAFTVTMTGTFNELSSSDIALGKCGVLYCTKDPDAESIFNSWKEGNDDAGCVVFDGGKAKTKSFNVTVTNLNPDTEYSFCLFFKSKDDSRREVSEISSFRTLAFEPEFKGMRADTVRMCYAIIKGGVVINSHDASQCSVGLILSDTVDGNLNDKSHVRVSNLSKNGNMKSMRYEANLLRAGITYYYRAFVKYTTPDKEEHVIYGPEKSFFTAIPDDWGVDLGLPSGIKWSKCELGRQDIDDAYDILFTDAYYCAWGSLKSDVYEKEVYEYVDTATHTYTYIGDNIAGTEYDVAHYVLGGKWRMPTKEDVEELIANCRFSRPSEAIYSFTYLDGEARLYTSIVTITGPNKNTIKTRMGEFWTASLTEDGKDPYVAYYEYDYEDTSKPGMFYLINEPRREYTLPIRAVWDPNM